VREENFGTSSFIRAVGCLMGIVPESGVEAICTEVVAATKSLLKTNRYFENAAWWKAPHQSLLHTGSPSINPILYTVFEMTDLGSKLAMKLVSYPLQLK
jgi:hypothetical protein